MPDLIYTGQTGPQQLVVPHPTWMGEEEVEIRTKTICYYTFTLRHSGPGKGILELSLKSGWSPSHTDDLN